jgi:hypothetical protein
MHGIFGADSLTRLTTPRNRSRIGSIIAEWNACDVCKAARRHLGGDELLLERVDLIGRTGDDAR